MKQTKTYVAESATKCLSMNYCICERLPKTGGTSTKCHLLLWHFSFPVCSGAFIEPHILTDDVLIAIFGERSLLVNQNCPFQKVFNLQ